MKLIKTKTTISLFAFLFFFSFGGHTQTVAGVYKGYMEVDSPKNTIRFELTLKEKKGKLTGYCHRLFILRDTLYYNLLKVSARLTDEMLVVEDDYSVSNNFEVNTRGIKTVFFFKLKDIRDTFSVIPGNWNTTTWKGFRGLTGSVNIIREAEPKTTQLYKRLTEKNLDQEMAFDGDVKEGDIVKTKQAKEIKKNQEKNNSDKPEEENTSKNRNQKSDFPEIKTSTDKENKTQEVKSVAKNEEREKKKEKTKQNNEIRSDSASLAMSTTTEKRRDEKKEKKQVGSTAPVEPNVSKTDTVKKETIALSKQDSLALKNDAFTKRSNEVTKIIPVATDSIVISLYDNGEVDGDVVSIFIDQKLVYPNVRLYARAQKFVIYTPKGKEVVVSLFAENMGSTPPNTGLLSVYLEDGREDVFFTSTFQKSSSVIFKR